MTLSRSIKLCSGSECLLLRAAPQRPATGASDRNGPLSLATSPPSSCPSDSLVVVSAFPGAAAVLRLLHLQTSPFASTVLPAGSAEREQPRRGGV